MPLQPYAPAALFWLQGGFQIHLLEAHLANRKIFTDLPSGKRYTPRRYIPWALHL